MKKIAFALIVIGVLLSVITAFGDFIGLGQRGEIGAAQILGIDAGILLVLIGIGLMTVEWQGKLEIGKGIRDLLNRVPEVSPTVWIVSTFVLIYLWLFVFPMFFTKPSIQYFTKYIPDAYVTHIGFDMDMTLGRVGRWLTTHQSPYSDSYYYSPVTLIIFAPLLVIGYPAYYKLSTIITLFSFVLCALFIPLLMASKKNRTLLLLFFITGLFSYGFQFELERGQYNVITFALSLLAIYLFHYHDKFRTFAYLLISLSIQLKIYPVILLVMFIKDWRDWRNNLGRILGLGILNFSLLFVLGYQMFLGFINNLTATQLFFQSSRREDLSIKGFVFDLTTDGYGMIQPGKLSGYSGLLEAFFLGVFAVCLISIIIHTYLHGRQGLNAYLFLLCAIGMLIIPSASVDYKLPLLVAPAAMTFSDLQIVRGRYKNIASAGLIMISSAAYWSTLYPFNIKPDILSRNFPALFVLLVSVTALYFLQNEKPESKIVSA